MKGSGWTGGRPVALKRLAPARRPARLFDGTRPAHAPLRAQGTSIFIGEGLYYFDEYATLPNLAGHPNVYNAASPSERIELIAYPVELVVKETAGGYNFNLSHRAERAEGVPRNGNAHALAGRRIVAEAAGIAGDAWRSRTEHAARHARARRKPPERGQSDRAHSLGTGGYRRSRHAGRRHARHAVAEARRWAEDQNRRASIRR